ncbi:protein SUPPRESSOR OF npr1-1, CONSTITUTIVE 1-like [Salvia divinorum]|uniref:Protein SUPPRESSOR OF npr1-1, CONSTITUTIVE 1-like n=1 Tax=Salvia divinorum TaxID=28513 RepID=A0ABD1FUY1_SALDI
MEGDQFASIIVSPETDSFTLDPIFIGKDDVLSDIVEFFSGGEEQKMSVLAIIGTDGIGKTSLTRRVFNHERMKARFELLIWVRVSQCSDSIVLLQKFLSAITSHNSDGFESQEVLLQKIQGALIGKTCLLVFDDVWNHYILKDFIISIMGVTSVKGNGIIITTTNQEAALKLRPLYIHSLSNLSDEDCWSIIKAKTFGDGNVPSSFEIIGRMIAKRCHGLPLAANVVGGLLWCKSEQEWLLINKNWFSEDEGCEDVSKILKLRFDHLPSPSLKKCFLCCSIFPKGEKMEKRELIELWMAEGFLQPDQGNDMESEGNKFLNVLLHNSFLQVEERDDYGNVKSCVMQNLVHDLAHSLLGSSYYVDFIAQVRHMIYSFGDKPNPIPEQMKKHVRTLIFEGEISDTNFSDYECLHVLSLKSDGVKELPKSIRKLIHLRKLNISHTSIVELPNWIGELHHLQTLSAESGCLRKLPSTLKYLINLRNLYIQPHVELPAEIGRLTSLRTLTHFAVGDNKGHRIEELGSLKNLKGELEILNLEKVLGKEEAEKAHIFEKPSLLDLRFVWTESGEGERNDESVLEGLQPHPNLKKLEIRGFKGKIFPSWTLKMAVRDGPQGSWVPLQNLIQITLSWCQECTIIPTMEHLPNLKYLYLKGLKKVRSIDSSFYDLLSLHIEELERLEYLPYELFYENQNLSKLWISGCSKLRELPDGLHTLNYLEDLFIWSCPNLRWIGDLRGRGQSPGILRRLRIGLCERLVMLPHLIIESWASTLQYLSLVELTSLRNLPMVIVGLSTSTRLKELRIVGTPKLLASRSIKSWPFDSLWKLRIDVSEEWSRETSVDIRGTVDGILQGCRKSLNLLKLIGVENWNWVPSSIQHLNALSWLILENLGLEEFPHWFRKLSSLEELDLINCKKLRSLPSGNASKCLTKLRFLLIKDCVELRIDSEWHNVPHLIIRVCDSTDGSVTTFPAVKPQKENVAESRAVSLGSAPIFTSESTAFTDFFIQEPSYMLDRVISRVSAADSNSSSLSGYETKQQFAEEIEEEGMVSGDSETEMSMSGFYSPQRVEQEYHGEILAVNEQQETELTSSGAEELTSTIAERSTKHLEENVTGHIYFQEKELYVIVLEDKNLLVKFDNHVILIGAYASLSLPNSSPVNAMLNLVEQRLHELSPNPDYPDSLIFLLQRNKRLTLIQPSFFDNMPELRFLDLSDTKIRILPSSLFKLSKLKVLLLRNCICIEKLPPEIGELEKMEVLDLSGTELYDLPAEISQLELVSRMHLSFYGPDDESEYEHLPYQLVSPCFLSEMKGIQSLSISVHPEDHRWKKTVAYIIEDISKLEMLSSLHFYFPQTETFENFIEMSPSWNNQRLSKFDFTVGQDVKRIVSRVPDEVESLFSQHERCLRYVNGDKTSSLVKSVIIRATAFYLDHHTDIQSLSEFDISSFRSMKFCIARECPKMRAILDEKNARGAFPCLEYLGIYFIWELRQIWKPLSQTSRLKRIFKAPIPVRNFEALKYLMIKTCPKLRFIFWESMLQCLANLEELVVEDCEGVEKIIEEESKNVKYQDNVLPRLRKLVLAYLPELVSLGCGVRMSEEKISVYGCPKLKRS